MPHQSTVIQFKMISRIRMQLEISNGIINIKIIMAYNIMAYIWYIKDNGIIADQYVHDSQWNVFF